MICTGWVIDSLPTRNLRMPGVSIVGAIASDLVAARLLHPGHHLLGVVEPVERGRLDHDVGEDAVQPVAHLVGEPGHDRVDHDHRGHAEHHADHAGQRDVAGAEIPPAEQVLVHVGHSFRGFVRSSGFAEQSLPRSINCGNGSPTASPASVSVGLCGRISGNRITSRMLGRFISIMQSRSMPMPRPPAGGMRVLQGADEVVVHLGHRVLLGQARRAGCGRAASCRIGSFSSV